MGELISFAAAKTERQMQGKVEAFEVWSDGRKNVPAYCDPRNESRGSKFEASRSLDIAEIAKLVRKDIAEAIKRGELPKGLKTSVRIERFSGGQSLDCMFTEIPESVTVFNVERIKFETENPRQVPNPYDYPVYTADYQKIVDTVKAIIGAYNRDNSDSMSDYFDVRFYSDVKLDWRIDRAIRERDMAKGGVA